MQIWKRITSILWLYIDPYYPTQQLLFSEEQNIIIVHYVAINSPTLNFFEAHLKRNVGDCHVLSQSIGWSRAGVAQGLLGSTTCLALPLSPNPVMLEFLPFPEQEKGYGEKKEMWTRGLG